MTGGVLTIGRLIVTASRAARQAVPEAERPTATCHPVMLHEWVDWQGTRALVVQHKASGLRARFHPAADRLGTVYAKSYKIDSIDPDAPGKSQDWSYYVGLGIGRRIYLAGAGLLPDRRWALGEVTTEAATLCAVGCTAPTPTGGKPSRVRGAACAGWIGASHHQRPLRGTSSRPRARRLPLSIPQTCAVTTCYLQAGPHLLAALLIANTVSRTSECPPFAPGIADYGLSRSPLSLVLTSPLLGYRFGKRGACGLRFWSTWCSSRVINPQLAPHAARSATNSFAAEAAGARASRSVVGARKGRRQSPWRYVRALCGKAPRSVAQGVIRTYVTSIVTRNSVDWR